MSDPSPGTLTARPRRRATRQSHILCRAVLDRTFEPFYLHMPFWHVDGATHTVPQLPQSALLVVVSTQVPAQSVYGGAQVHVLFTQVRLPPQFAPQKPQFPLLLVRSTQLLPHCAWPERHVMTHVPMEHRGVAPGQRNPHVLQFVLLCWRSTQRPRPMNAPPAHCVFPAAQVHVPSTQVEPTSHATPHAPQLAALVLRSTQVVAIIIMPIGPRAGAVQAVRPPVPQPAAHAPFWQVVFGPQRIPHAPQLASSAFVFVQVVPHRVSPPPHVQMPLTQLPPMAHCLLQALQLMLSVVRSTQAPLQLVSDWPASVPVHVVTHAPLLQTCPAAHATPHPPQLSGSLCTAVHAPPLHAIPPFGHSHWPATHCRPAAQRALHPPQFALSLWTSMHAPLHSTLPFGQTHVPAVQDWPGAHFAPHAPQLFGSATTERQVPLQ